MTKPKAKHIATYTGHKGRKGIRARWGWMCSCGVGTVLQVLTIAEARRRWKEHSEKMK